MTAARRAIAALAVPALAAGWGIGYVTRPDVHPDRTIGATLTTSQPATPTVTATATHRAHPVEAPTVHHTTPPLVTTTPPAAPTKVTLTATLTAPPTTTATDSPPPLTGLGGATTTPRSTP